MFKRLLTVLAMFYAAASFAAVDVNTATVADLDGVKGIGPGISGKIIEERKKGAFKDWNDLIARVKGVGDKNAAKFSTSGMTVNGAAYAGAPEATTKAPRMKQGATPATPATPTAAKAANTNDMSAKAAVPTQPSKQVGK